MVTRPTAGTTSAKILAFTCLLIIGSMVLASLSLAAKKTEFTQSSVVMFDDNSASTVPKWEITDSNDQLMTVEFTLPALELRPIQANNQLWQTLNIEGAVESGKMGEPGLPTISKLVAVPAGMTLSAQLISTTSSHLSDLQILPVQDTAQENFSYSTLAYQNKASANSPELIIQIGRSAILAGQTVVPVTINLVNYDAANQKATVWTSATLELSFIPDSGAPATARKRVREIPTSFATHLQSEVLGFQPQSSSNGEKSESLNSILGTYVAVHSGNSSVITGISPLLQWRRQQGYNVVEINTAISGGTTASIKNALKDIYQNDTIAPLEFVSIFGDATGSYQVPAWIETLSGYNGGGDHYYAMLDGDDILADVHIGRVSFGSITELNNIVGKILGYEKTPPMDDTEWYGRACLQGDPSASGITTIYTNQWVKDQLLDLGWTKIDTTWSGNFVSPMMSQVGQGVSAYGYRGFYGTSGISNGHVSALSNGGKLAMALLPTCASGSFASETARSEAWLRAPNGGAVAAIGTATTGTHTRYNNCYYLGTWDGLLNREDHRIGTAHTLGKIALYTGYYLAEPDRAEIWAVWNNIMGDPATAMWIGVPQTLEVNYPAQISVGAQAMTVSVNHEGSPVAGAQVCLHRDSGSGNDEVQIIGVTDATGQLVLNIPNLSNGSITLTATKQNYLPHLGGFTIGQVDVFCAATNSNFDDGADGIINPQDTISVTPSLTNHGSSDAFGVSAEMSVLSGPATISTGSLNFGTIATGSEVASAAAAIININADAMDGATIKLLITATDGQETWTSLLEETVKAAAFSIVDMDLSDFSGNLDPGESGRFDLTLENLGNQNATAITTILSTDSPWVTIIDNTANFGSISTGETGRDLLSPFRINLSTDCFGGHLASFELAITYNDGSVTTTQTAVTIGTASTDQPTGPDAYGYYAIDNTDSVSPLAPEYNWVGIDPDHDAQGTDLELSDFNWEQDDTKTIALPFEFGFYGDTYEHVSICSNGWLAMGETQVNFYRNFPMPSSHSARALIAPFWDNLNQTGNKKVYTWYDEDEHRFIVQWYEMPNHFTGSPQNFEVILLDPAFYPTSTGDGMIIFQYAEVNNTDSRDGYATVGIQNLTRDVGLNYSYWNQYNAGAAPLAAGRAILFAPTGDFAMPVASVTPGVLNTTVPPDEQITEYLHITNNGDEGSVLSFSINKIDPAIVALGKSAVNQNDTVNDDDVDVETRSLLNSNVTSTVTEYDAGATVDFPFQVLCQSPDDEWLMKVELDLPEGVTVNSASNLSTPHGPMSWNNETGDGTLTSWGNIDWGSGIYLANNDLGSASLNLSFAPSLTGEVVIDWVVIGDGFGANPHQVSGQIILTTAEPGINVNQPNEGDIATLGESFDVAFNAVNGPSSVNIDLQREEGGTWESLALDLNANSTPWSWDVTGEPTPYARIRVSDAASAETFGLSGVFAISRNLDWLQLSAVNGAVNWGETLDLAMTLDSTGLGTGIYQANIVISGNGGAPITVPVTMTVSDVSAVNDLPVAVALLGNHPNPFNPQTTISFALPTDQNVKLKIYSTRGALVRSLLHGPQLAGMHRAVWNGRDDRGQGVASGVYFYRLETGDGNFTGKMVLTK